jgi:hypothetical protein
VPNPGPGKALCEAQRTNQSKGLTCHLVAGYGTDHVGVGRCKWHGGCTPTHNEHAQVEQIKQAADRLGVPREVDPSTGILELVWEAAGNVEYYRQLVQALPTHPTPDTPPSVESPFWTRGEPGIYGLTYHQSGIPTGEAKRHILVQMYDDERKELRETIKTALAAKVDERRVALAEAQGRDLLASVGRAMTAAALSPEQAEAFRRVLIADLRSAQPAVTAG